MLIKTLDFCVKTVALVILLNLASNGLTDGKLQAQSKPSSTKKTKVEFVPPKGAGIPRSPTTAGGTRPIICKEIYACLIPLMPEVVDKLDYYPLTVSERPTFFVNVPKISGTAIFTLYQHLSSDEIKKIYRFSFPIKTSGGIINITLPTSAPALQLDNIYEWTLSVNGETANGLVRRVQLKPNLAQKIAQASLLEKLAIYATEGVWYDSVETLAELRTSQPNNPEISTQWSDFLKSVHIDKFAKQNFAPCCLVKN